VPFAAAAPRNVFNPDSDRRNRQTNGGGCRFGDGLNNFLLPAKPNVM
jgi:hypothetical protein